MSLAHGLLPPGLALTRRQSNPEEQRMCVSSLVALLASWITVNNLTK